MEEIEYADWSLPGSTLEEWIQTSLPERKKLSIQAYYLPRWYEEVKDFTFETIIYSTTAKPKLPPGKWMVRYEHRSPKDSEYWGPVHNITEINRVFNTSLRCQVKGDYICLREWVALTTEYRCFWNCGLVAIASVDDTAPPVTEILAYIRSFSSKIPYQRCVFDIALDINGKYWLVEFNSWETNSGAHTFDWRQDTDILYPETPDKVCVRWGKEQCKYTTDLIPRSLPTTSFIPPDDLVILPPTEPSCWLLLDNGDFLVGNDIYVGLFTPQLKPKQWVRASLRFGNIHRVGEHYYFDNRYWRSDLYPVKVNNSLPTPAEPLPTKLIRYGFRCYYGGAEHMIRFHPDATFETQFDS